ncbi:MAG: T9SS type A sorting domain-containing protein, partial [Ginsengibacter sp.]
IYPNPTGGPLIVLIPNILVGTNAILSDVGGRTISIIKLSNNSNLINLGNVASDVYFLKFADGNVREIIRQ